MTRVKWFVLVERMRSVGERPTAAIAAGDLCVSLAMPRINVHAALLGGAIHQAVRLIQAVTLIYEAWIGRIPSAAFLSVSWPENRGGI